MSRNMLILITVISIVAFAGSIYVLCVEQTINNIMIAAILLLIIIYEIWQIRKTPKKNNKQ